MIIAPVIAIIPVHISLVSMLVLVGIGCFLDDLAEVIGIGHRAYRDGGGAQALKYKPLLAKLAPLSLLTLG